MTRDPWVGWVAVAGIVLAACHGPAKERAKAPATAAVTSPDADHSATAVLTRWAQTQGVPDGKAHAALYADDFTAELGVRGRVLRQSRTTFLAARLAEVKKGVRVAVDSPTVTTMGDTAVVTFRAERAVDGTTAHLSGTLVIVQLAKDPRIARESLTDNVIAPAPETLPELLPSSFAFVVDVGTKHYAVLGPGPGAGSAGPGPFLAVFAPPPASQAPAMAVRPISKTLAWNNAGWSQKAFRAYLPGDSCVGVTGDLGVMHAFIPHPLSAASWANLSGDALGKAIWNGHAAEYLVVELVPHACKSTSFLWAHLGDTKLRTPLSSMYPSDVAGPARDAFLASEWVQARTAQFQAQAPAFQFVDQDFSVNVWGVRTTRMLVTVGAERPHGCDGVTAFGLLGVGKDTFPPVGVTDRWMHATMAVDVDGDGRTDAVGTDDHGLPMLVRQGKTAAVALTLPMPYDASECDP